MRNALRQQGVGLGPGQRGAFAVGKERGFAPGTQGIDALLGFAEGAGVLGVHVKAVGAPVDLRDADLDQLHQRFVDAVLAATLPRQVGFQPDHGGHHIGGGGLVVHAHGGHSSV